MFIFLEKGELKRTENQKYPIWSSLHKQPQVCFRKHWNSLIEVASMVFFSIFIGDKDVSHI